VRGQLGLDAYLPLSCCHLVTGGCVDLLDCIAGVGLCGRHLHAQQVVIMSFDLGNSLGALQVLPWSSCGGMQPWLGSITWRHSHT
jgi:hypothetical protein